MFGRTDSEIPIPVAVTGAGGEFGRTFLAQLRSIPAIQPTVLVDRDLRRLARMLDELSYHESYTECGSAAEVADAVRAGRIAITDRADTELPEVFDVLVEATGDLGAGFRYARDAVAQGRHVVMVSKEVESVTGRWLARRAADRDLRYIPGRGDQPANLCALLAWTQWLGFEVVAAGKSSEYDVVFDPATGTASYLGTDLAVPRLAELLDARTATRAVLESRGALLESLLRPVAADLCEISVVSQRLGIAPDTHALHYPVARINELADVYAMYADGGIMDTVPALDVFTVLRLPNEASFAGGVFVVVRAADATTWRVLADKGHVVSRSGSYACLYLPYHLMGVETPLSVFDAAGRRPDGAPLPLSAQPGHLMHGRAQRELPAGHRFRVSGHHHQIDGVRPVLEADEGGMDVPFYLLDGATLRADHRQGDRLLIDDVDGLDGAVLQAFQESHGTSTGQINREYL